MSTDRFTPIALFAGGLLAGLYQFTHPAGFGFGHGFEMSAIARNLAEHGAFANPFEPAITGPTAVVPPLYPFFLAILIKLFKLPVLIVTVATLANVVVNACIAALMPRLSVAFFDDARPGVFAGVLWIFSIRLMPQWDASYTVAGLILFCLFTAHSLSTGRTLRSAATAGIIGGLLTLMNPASALVFLPWTLFLLISRRVPLQPAIRYASVLVLAVGLSNVPWIVRNYLIWHAFALRTNFGMTLYSSNNDCAQSSIDKDGQDGCYQSTHPVASESEIRLLQTLGEVRYDRVRTAAAFDWIHTHPSRYRQLTLARIGEFWFPESGSPAEGVFHIDPVYTIWTVTILSIPGIVLMARRRVPVTWFAIFVWVLYPLMYYSVVSANRYRYPVLWTSLLPAAYCLHALERRLRLGTGA